MDGDFIRIKSLSGELKRSHKKKGLGITVSTEELVFQQPHVNYHILLKDIVSIVPFSSEKGEPVTVIHRGGGHHEVAKARLGTADRFRFYVKKAVIHNRSGRKTMGPMQFVMPVHGEMLREIAEYGEMDAFF